MPRFILGLTLAAASISLSAQTRFTVIEATIPQMQSRILAVTEYAAPLLPRPGPAV